MGLIDSHAHLTFPELRDQVAEVLARCDEAGVDRVITIGINLQDAREAVALAEDAEAAAEIAEAAEEIAEAADDESAE